MMAGPTHQSLITVIKPVIQVATLAGSMTEPPEVQVQVFQPAMDLDSDWDSEAEFP